MQFNLSFPVTPRQLRSLLRDDEEVEHPPIVIVDGSVTIQFSSTDYSLMGGTNKYVSSEFSLKKVRSINKRQLGEYCPALPINVPTRIVLTCQSDTQTTEIVITGSNSASGGSPSIEFDPRIFAQVTSLDPKYQKYFNFDYKVRKMEIFTINAAGAMVLHHDCPFAKDGNCYEITIDDGHAAF